MKHNRSMEITLVKLKGGAYGEHQGAIGYVQDTLDDEHLVAVHWLIVNPTHSYHAGSVPVRVVDLEIMGLLLVSVPDDLIDEEIERAEVSLPPDLVMRRARQLVQEVSYDVSQRLLGRLEQRGENKRGEIK